MPGVWNNRGTALRRLRRLEEALASYERAAALAPSHVNAITNRAIALFDLRRLEEALAASEAALAVQADFAEALYVAGNILRDMGRLAEAQASFEQALQSSAIPRSGLERIGPSQRGAVRLGQGGHARAAPAKAMCRRAAA